jgi:hypothetical protein
MALSDCVVLYHYPSESAIVNITSSPHGRLTNLVGCRQPLASGLRERGSSAGVQKHITVHTLQNTEQSLM